MGCGISKSGPHGHGGDLIQFKDVIFDGNHEDDINSKIDKDDDPHREDTLASPGSPSFREYCIHSPMEDTPHNTHHNILPHDDFDIHQGANRESNKESSDEVELGKKANKGRSSMSGIRSVLAKQRGKQAKLRSYINATRQSPPLQHPQ